MYIFVIIVRLPLLNKGLLTCSGYMPAVGAKRVENVVDAIEKLNPFIHKFSPRHWRMRLIPRPPNSE